MELMEFGVVNGSFLTYHRFVYNLLFEATKKDGFWFFLCMRYALSGVEPLLKLREKIPVKDRERVMAESQKAASYRYMNTQYESAAQMAKIGTEAMIKWVSFDKK